MKQLETRGIVHVTSHLLAHFIDIVILLQYLAEHLDVVLGALLPKILQKETFHIIQFRAFHIAIGLHYCR